MGITSILLMITLVTIILVIWVFVKRRFHFKRIFKIIIITLLSISCITFGAYQYSLRSSGFIFTKTTNFNEENIGGLQLYKSINSKEFIKKYGTNSQRIDNTVFDYYKLNDGLVIATNKNRQIIRIIIDDESDKSIKTSKGITLKSSVDDVIKAYGTNYYKRMDDTGVSVIGYVDKKSKVTLEFFNYKNEVTMIRYDISSMQ
ncbi:hypothetical protein KPL47_21325 [Clostridium estertheticum]|uniref:hypothetical protein n=1 Tax=Clostridium estertheticum TaxID=238834 RepID=UPI001C0D303B|nr:hypothetical protein [Clostridium estertheticum]MBU3178855.1 hypothetical protein [Clostridium estertheticum]